MERNCKIYTLSHPITNEVRYVGKTVETLEKRLGKHIADSRRRSSRCAAWIKSISKLNLNPIIEEIDEVLEVNSSECEIYWIAQFKAWNFRLINHTIGGEGSVGFKHSEESKLKMSTLAKGNKNRLGLTHSDKAKLNISKGGKGKIVSEEGKNNISKGKIGRVPKTPVIKVDTGDKYKTIREAAKANNITESMLSKKLRRGDKDYIYDIPYKVIKDY